MSKNHLKQRLRLFLAVYPTLLATLVTDGNYTLFADDHGTSYMIDESEPVPTAVELAEIEESALETFFFLFTR